ncbi:hypothetical protein ACFVTP_09035 [Streptomyces celluloflavus]|uniref:hypothetical protein n=1 Tax=Streptomyces celluloflavus TaxID=58344 RepID=UPI0036DB25F6
MALLPPTLRCYDGHPLADLAAQVMSDLFEVGIPVHVIDEKDDHSLVNGGITLHLGEPSMGVLMSWHVPNEGKHARSKSHAKARVFGSVATLSSAVVSILTNFGYRVRTEFDEADYPYPVISVLPFEGRRSDGPAPRRRSPDRPRRAPRTGAAARPSGSGDWYGRGAVTETHNARAPHRCGALCLRLMTAFLPAPQVG